MVALRTFGGSSLGLSVGRCGRKETVVFFRENYPLLIVSWVGSMSFFEIGVLFLLPSWSLNDRSFGRGFF